MTGISFPPQASYVHSLTSESLVSYLDHRGNRETIEKSSSNVEHMHPYREVADLHPSKQLWQSLGDVPVTENSFPSQTSSVHSLIPENLVVYLDHLGNHETVVVFVKRQRQIQPCIAVHPNEQHGT